MNICTRFSGLALMLGLASFASCGGGPGGSAPDSGAGSDLDGPRLAAIAAVEDQARSLEAQHLAPLDQLTAIAAFMAARPEYMATAIDAESLSASGVFRDGRLHLVTLNYTPGPPIVASAAAAPISAAAAGAELPAAPYARLFHSFGTGFPTQASIDDAKTYLTSRGWKLRSVAEGDARVETLRGVSGDGLFYINTHGGRVKAGVDPSKEPEGKLYALDSSTIVSDQLEKIPEYADDLAKQRLVYFTAHNGETKSILGISYADWDTRYGITRYFVDAYWGFAAHSVVMINACFSSRNAEFIASVRAKGAEVYLGWSEKIDPATVDSSLRYLVDRMVGANKYQPESPPQRPFAYDLVLADMASKGLDVYAATGAKLEVSSAAPVPPALAPSIRVMTVDESANQLKLKGGFGLEQGTVTVDGTPLVIQSWAPDLIVCTLPLNGPGSSGDVQVEVHGVRSNLRQLTQWAMSLHYHWTNPTDITGLVFDGTAPLRFRADAAGYRDRPAAALTFPTRGMVATHESGLPLTGSGSNGTPTCTRTLSGSGTFPSPPGNIPSALVLGNMIKVDTRTKQGAIGLGFGGAAGSLPFKITFTGTSCSGSNPFAPAFGLMDGPDMFPASPDDDTLVVPLPALQITFTDQLVLRGRDYPDARLGGTMRVTWSDVTPTAPPRDDADSGK